MSYKTIGISSILPILLIMPAMAKDVISGEQTIQGITRQGDGNVMYSVADGANVTVKDSIFTDNIATGEYSGMIFHVQKTSDKSILTIENSKFLGNYSGYVGGAIKTNPSSVGAYGTQLNISMSEFKDNHAYYDGGAVGNYSGLNISGSLFEGNTAHLTKDADGNWSVAVEDAIPVGGGALALGAVSNTSVGTISDTVFVNNKSGTNGGAIGTRQGIVANNSSAKLDVEATFIGNEALQNGGAIYNSFYADNNLGKGAGVTVSGVFANNKAGNYGGAIYNDGSIDKAGNPGGVITISNSQFVGNVAKKRAGALYNTGIAKISDSIFIGNKAESQGYGGAIFNGQGLLTIENSQFDGNWAEWDGGAISSATSYLSEKNKPEDYTASDFSAANVRAYWESKNGFSASNKMVINNSAFTNNVAGKYSGGALGIYSDAFINGSTFTNNNAGGHMPADDTDGGGAIYAGGWARIDLTNSVFNHNSSNYGGAIATTRAGIAEGIYLHVTDTNFNSNIATVSGGAISNKFADAKITNANFSNNFARVSGGAIFNEGIIDFAGTNKFSGNTVAGGIVNDIHNMGTINIASGVTTIGGGVTGDGTFTVAEGATLNIGTALIEQGTINLDGIVSASVLNDTNYGRLHADTMNVGANSKLQLNVGSAGTYKIFNKHAQIAIDAGDAYVVENNGVDGVIIKTKAVQDIAKDAGITTGAAATISLLANNKDAVLNMASLNAQQALAAGDIDYIETESAKARPTDKPVVHSVSSSVQNQIMQLAAARMSGTAVIGRSGGDFANTDWGMWAHGLFNKSKFGDQFHGYTRGAAVGFDAHVNRKYTIGAGYAYNTTDVHANARDTDIDSNTVFVYGQYKPSYWYVNGTLNYTFSKYDEKTQIFGISIGHEHDVNTFGGQVMTGYDLPGGLTPEAGLRYLHIAQDDYNNGLGRVKGGDSDFMTGIAGIKYAFAIDAPYAVKWTPQLRAAATYDFVSDDTHATIVIPGAPAYVANGDRLSRMGGEFGIGLNANYHGLDISLDFSLTLHEDYTSQTGMLKFRYNF